ncbi:MAG TPA: DUF4403 family protein [Rhizomicrobium sp.]|nr:DUF4403 family protein [Rhizomicrobium sp.]
MHPRLMLVALLALLVSACSWRAEPDRTPAPPAPRPPLSTIAATLIIPENEIATLLDGLTADHIADLRNEPVKCGIGRCRLTLLARRAGPIIVGGSGDRLELRMPFTAHAEIAAPGFLSVLRARSDGTGEATSATELTIGPDWRLRPSTQGTVRLRSGDLHLGPLIFDIADLWNANQGKLSAPLWRAMDRQLAHVAIKPQIARAWAELFDALPVGKAPPAWLVLRPEQLRVARPAIGTDGVTVSLELDVRGEVVTGNIPPSNPPTPLPRPEHLGAPSDIFAVAVPVLLPYEEAARLAMASLQKKPPHLTGATLIFSDLKILPSGQDVVVAARFCIRPGWVLLSWLSPCGETYLRGTPRFEAASGTIRISDVRFDTAGGSFAALLQLVGGNRIASLLQNHLVFHEHAQIARLDRQIAQALATPQGNIVQIAADIQSFGAPRFTWTDKGFLALFSAKGRTRTTLRL